MDQLACPFCTGHEGVVANQLSLARWDTHPVTPGHVLIVTRRHVADFFQTTTDERHSLLALLQQTKDLVQQMHRPDGFNVGVNVGEAAGQTIPHVHIHLIPRYRGDTPHPRGGVRSVIAGRQSY